MNRFRAAVLITTLVTSACSSTLSGRPPGDRLAFRPSPDQIVFQVSYGPGFTAPSTYLGARPSVTIYGSGDAFVTTDANDGFPVELMHGTVPRDELRDLAADAAGSELFAGADFGTVRITDVGDTSVTFRPTRAPARRVSVYALDIDEVDDTLTSGQEANRQALRTLAQRLRDSVTNLSRWMPSRVDVTEIPDYTGGVSTPVTRWPGPRLGTLLHGSQRGRCGVLAGRAAQEVYLAARQQRPAQWAAGGTRHALVIRALLPGETGCGR